MCAQRMGSGTARRYTRYCTVVQLAWRKLVVSQVPSCVVLVVLVVLVVVSCVGGTHLRKAGNLGTEELDELGDNGRECCMARAKRA